MTTTELPQMRIRPGIPCKTLGALVLLFTWDVAVGQPLTALVASIALLAALPFALQVALAVGGAVLKTKRGSHVGDPHGGWRAELGRSRDVLRVLLLLAAVALSLGTFRHQRLEAQARAEEVIAAVDAYHADEGDYPPRLSALVPRYLPSVPHAYPGRWMTPRFEYRFTPEAPPRLQWTTLPPFGRTFYRFEDGSFGTFD